MIQEDDRLNGLLEQLKAWPTPMLTETIELWRLRSPVSGADVVCSARGIWGVDLEFRVGRKEEFYQTRACKTVDNARVQSGI